MNRRISLMMLVALAGLSWPTLGPSEVPPKKDDAGQSKSEDTPPKSERYMTLIVTPPEGWFRKRFRSPSDGIEHLFLPKTEDKPVPSFGIFRHPGFNASPYTPEGIADANIRGSFIPGGLPFRTKSIKVGEEKLDGVWLGYTHHGNVTDLVFVKHENNVYRLSGTYPKDDEKSRDLFWVMVKSAEFVESTGQR